MSSREPQSLAALLEFFGNQFDFDRASSDDVVWIAGAGDCISAMSNNLSSVLVGIGCLVSEDSRHPTSSGGFTSDDRLPALLWNIGDSLDSISRLSSIVNNANFHLRKRQSKPIKKAEVSNA